MLGISSYRPLFRVVCSQPKTNSGILTAPENCSAFLSVLRGPSSRTSRLKAFLRDACRTGEGARPSKDEWHLSRPPLDPPILRLLSTTFLRMAQLVRRLASSVLD